MTNIGNSLLVVKNLVQLHKDDPVVVGMTPGTYVRKNICMYTCTHACNFKIFMVVFLTLNYFVVWLMKFAWYRPISLLIPCLTISLHWCIICFSTSYSYSYILILLHFYIFILIFSYSHTIIFFLSCFFLFLVNEPWDRIPMDVLKDFYWQSYQIVQTLAPQWITLLHDSFRLSVGKCRESVSAIC